jgi:hypothetical protein
VYTNAPRVQITVNNVAVPGASVEVPPFGSAAFTGVPYTPGSVSARCLSADGGVLEIDTKHSWGKPFGLRLTLDAPSATTGTGSALYLDGADVALVRAAVVDEAGWVVHDSTMIITFNVTSGPGRVAGVGNGDPADRDPNHASWKRAYHGLARGVIKVTLLASGTPELREITADVNPDAGVGVNSSRIAGRGEQPPLALIVSASAPGLETTYLSIPLSVNPVDDPLNVAAANVASADIGE